MHSVVIPKSQFRLTQTKQWTPASAFMPHLCSTQYGTSWTQYCYLEYQQQLKIGYFTKYILRRTQYPRLPLGKLNTSKNFSSQLTQASLNTSPHSVKSAGHKAPPVFHFFHSIWLKSLIPHFSMNLLASIPLPFILMTICFTRL